jgi:hypothetical protein
MRPISDIEIEEIVAISASHKGSYAHLDVRLMSSRRATVGATIAHGRGGRRQGALQGRILVTNCMPSIAKRHFSPAKWKKTRPNEPIDPGFRFRIIMSGYELPLLDQCVQIRTACLRKRTFSLPIRFGLRHKTTESIDDQRPLRVA